MKKVLYSVLLIILAVVAVGCGANNNNNGNSNNDGANSSAGESVLVKHELGETTVTKNPEKVVVFDFGILDSLDSLGVDVVGVPQMGIPSYLEKYAAADYENIGSLKEPDFEKIAEIDPDLIIISARQAEMYDELQELGETIYLGVDTNRYMESFKENTEILGEIFNKESEVADVLAKIDTEVTDIKGIAEATDKNALIILANDDKVSAYGANSRFGIIHDVLGVQAVDENIEVSTHGQSITFEYIVEKDPDLLYVVDRSAAIGEGSAAEQLVENKLMEKTKAYQNKDIIYLDPDFWYLSGGGIVSVQEMIKEIKVSLEK